jgi:hypothetical protein
MKTKGITIWERHAEKFVLGVAVVLFVGFAALQFIGEPNAVSTPEGEVAPGKIDRLLEDRANRIRVLISDDAEAKVDLPAPKPALAELRREMDESLSPAPTINQFRYVQAPSIEGLPVGPKAKYPVPAIPAPQRVVVVQTADALAEGVVSNYPELQKLFPDPDQPHDLTWTTVVVPVSLEAIRQQMQQAVVDQESNQSIKIPPGWYNERPANIVDVVIERQEFVKGSWQDSEELAPIPGQFGFRSKLSGEIDAALRDEVLGLLAVPRNQVDLIQPPFYPLKNDALEIPALDQEQMDEAARARQEEINEIRADLVGYERRRETLLDELQRKGGERRERDAGGDDRGGDTGGPSGGGGAGRRAPPGKGKRDAPGKGAGGFGEQEGTGKRDEDVPGTGKRQISAVVERRLNSQIDSVERQIEGAWRRLEALGVDPNADAEGPVDPETILEKNTVVAWGHDLYAKPGKTYRYRVTLRVYNPFFGQKRALIEEQEHLADSFTLDSPASAWSNSVQVSPFLDVYITRAVPPGEQRGGSYGLATAEVYRFRRGEWHMERFTVAPGAYIGGKRTVEIPGEDRTEEVDFGTGLFVLDIVPNIDDGSDNAAGGLLNANRDAMVWVQNVATGEVEQRDPAVEAEDAKRLDLLDRLARAREGDGRPL